VTPDLVIVTPEAAPGAGGVADHTLALLKHWGRVSNFHLLVSKPAPEVAGQGAAVEPLGRTSTEIMVQLPKTNGTVFVQYSAYGYNRFGYPRELIRALVDWKKKSGGRLVIMFHEIWTFWSFTNKNFFVQQLHRRALKRLLTLCDAAFTTTSSQAEHLQRLSDAVPVHVLPVGSNISPARLGNVPRQEGLAALFGVQLSRIRALENMRKSLTSLAAAGRITKIVCLGQEHDSGAREDERKLLAALNLPDGFVQQGALSADTVSEILSTASFGIFGQSELSCTKSGSFMAYATHQLNVIADFSDAQKSPPVCWLTATEELLAGIDQAELDRRAECLRMWQEENCSWKVIAGRLGRALAIDPLPGGA